MSELDGATPDEPVVDDAPVFEADKPIEGEDALGDPGKRALQTMRDQLREAEKKLLDVAGNNSPGEADTYKKKWRDADKAARDARAEIERIQAEAALRDKPAEEQAIEAAKAEARTEATVAANKRILRSELKALATGKLANPEDAHLYINLDDFTVDESGETDSDALTEAIFELIERKPNLAAQKQSRFDGDADQGAKGKDSAPPQWTEADLAAATDDETVAAKAAGLLNNLLGIKP